MISGTDYQDGFEEGIEYIMNEIKDWMEKSGIPVHEQFYLEELLDEIGLKFDRNN
jgi:hypothetical protein